MTETSTKPFVGEKQQADNVIDPEAVGVEASWSFGNGNAEAVTLARETVRDIIAQRGFDPGLIIEMDADMALRKAQHTVKGRSKSIVIQELRRPNKDTPRAFGVYKVVGKDGEAGDDVVMGARARVEGQHVVCLPPEGDSVFVDADCERICNEITRIANSLIDNVINRDISDMLVAIGWSRLGWISRRRNSGGVYFIGRSDAAERYVGLLQDLQKATAVNTRAFQFIPQVMEVYPKPLTMDMWQGSARDQYEGQTEQLLKDLAKMKTDDKMRDGTIQARADECDRLIELAESHRLFLADAVEGITTELARVKAEFTKKLDENAASAAGAFNAVEAAIADADAKVPTKKARKAKAKPKAEAKPAKLDPKTASLDDLFNV